MSSKKWITIAVAFALAFGTFALTWPPIRNLPTKRAALRLGEDADSLHLSGLVTPNQLSKRETSDGSYAKIDVTIEDKVKIRAITSALAKDALNSRIRIFNAISDAVMSKVRLECEFKQKDKTIGTLTIESPHYLFVDEKHFSETEVDLIEKVLRLAGL